MRLETALPTKKLYAYKSLSSRIFFGWKGKSARFKKTVAQNNPFIARRKTDLKRGFTPKKAYAYKSPVMARLSDGSGWFPPRLLSARQLRSIQLRGAISLCALPPAREYAILKINVRQKSTGNLHAYTLALYHSYLHKSIETQTFVCIFLF